MKVVKTLSVLSTVLLSSASVLAQDPVKVDPTHYKVVLENASVRVLKIDYAAGTKSAAHQHPEAIVVALSDGKVLFAMPDGKSQESTLPKETAMYTPAGTHTVTNLGGQVDALLIEFKAAAPGKATLPATREGLQTKVLAEGPRAVAYRSTAAPTFAEPAGSKHDYDQIVIALGPTQMSLAIDGKPAKTTWARGDVAFIGRGVAHESKNTSGKPTDMVIVAVK